MHIHPRIEIASHCASSLALLSTWIFFFLAQVSISWTQESVGSAAALRDRIANELKLIQDAHHQHFTDIEMGRLWGRLAFDYQAQGDVQLSEEAYLRAFTFLQKTPSRQNDYATVLGNLASLYLETGRIKESENCRWKELAVREAIGDKLGVARVRGQLAVVLINQNKFREAKEQALTALGGMQEQQDAESTDIAATLIPLSFARCMLDVCKEGLADASRAVAILRATFPPNRAVTGSAWLIGGAHLILGFAQWKTGAIVDADASMREAIQIFRSDSTLPPAVLRWGLVQYSSYLKAMHRKEEAHQLSDEIDLLARQEIQACRSCTIDVRALSSAFR